MIYSKIHGRLSFSQEFIKVIENGSNSNIDLYDRCDEYWYQVCQLSAFDALVLTEVYRAYGAYSRSRAVLRVAKSLYPKDVRLAVSWAHYLSNAKSPLVAINYLSSSKPNSKSEEELINESKVQFSSAVGFISEAEKLFNKKIYDENIALQSRVSYALRQWKDARVQTEKALSLSSDNPFLKNQLIDTLLAIGDVAQASKHARDLMELDEHAIAEIDYYLIFVFFALDEIEYSKSLAQKYFERWPDADNRTGIRCWLIRFLAFNNQFREAAELVEDLPEALKSTMAPLATEGRHRILNMPITCQGKDRCVPTAIGMICHHLGMSADTDKMYQEMGGVEGTELWRAHDVMESKGMTVTYVDLNIETIKRLIDEGIPILAQTSGLFSSHVEVINGYDDAEQCVYIRDPANWYPILIGFEHIKQRYASIANYGICFTKNAIDIDYVPSEAGANLIHLARCCETGNVDDISPLIEKLRVYPEIDFDVAQQCYGITLDPVTYEDKLAKVVNDPKTPEHVKIGALLQTNNAEILKTWLKEQGESASTSTFVKRYVKVLHDYLKDDWGSCAAVLTDLISLYPYQSSLWLFHAEVALALGDIDRALKSVKFALELSPDSIWTINRVFFLFPHLMTYEELYNKLQLYESRRPNSISAIEFAAQLYWEGVNGEKFESVALECIGRRPKLPKNYTRLANWYLSQEREDLAKQILNSGRKLLGEEQLPLWGFEKTQNSAIEESEETSNVEVVLSDLVNQIEQVVNNSEGAYSKIDALREILFRGMSNSSRVEKSELRKLLPSSLPGVFPHNLSYYLDGLNFPYVEYSLQKNIFDWSLQIIGDQSCSLELAFNIAYLTELLGDYATAETKYRSLSEKYSGHSGSLYRLGVLEQRRGNLNEAVKRHEEVLKHSPGLVGSIDALVDLNSKLSQTGEVIKWCRYRVNFHPYDMGYLETLLDQLVYIESMELAFKELEKYKRYCTNEYFDFHQARIYVGGGKFEEALAVLKSKSDNSLRHVLVTKLIAYRELGQFEDALNCCEKWLDRSPNDYWFKDNQVDVLISLERIDQAIALLEEQIKAGDPSHRCVEQYFQLKKPSVEEVKSLFKSCADGVVVDVVEMVGGISQNYMSVNDWKEVLITINESYPDAFHARKSLSFRFMMAHEHSKAIEIAEDIYDRSGQNEKWLYPLACVYEDTRREEALKLYQEYYDRTGDVDALIDIGRCHHLNSELEEAQHFYKKAVSLNPYADLAVNNLVQMGGDIAPYADDFYRMIDAGYGSSTQYFCINAIKCAIAAKKVVSSNWAQVAEERIKMIAIEKPFKDEPQRLSVALSKWYKAQGDSEKARLFKKQSGLRGSLLSLVGWPSNRWIPSKK